MFAFDKKLEELSIYYDAGHLKLVNKVIKEIKIMIKNKKRILRRKSK